MARSKNVFLSRGFLFGRYSSWSKLLRVCVWVVCFKQYFLMSRKSKKIVSSITSQFILSLKEINNAKSTILSHAQSLAFPDEIESLKQDQSIKKLSNLFRLDPF